MIHLRSLPALALLCVLLAGCGEPRIISHPALTLPPVPDGLASLMEDQCPVAQGAYNRCDPASPLGAPVEQGGMGCDVVALPDDALGGLDPAYPILRCEIRPYLHDDIVATMQELEASGAYVQSGGGLAPLFLRYVIQQGDELRLLVDRAALAEAYAPIESAEEALSLAVAATGMRAMYGLQVDRALDYELDELEDTYVSARGDGWEVLLYSYSTFGCGPHYTDVVRVGVDRNGTVTQLGREHAFRDPAEDNLCVD